MKKKFYALWCSILDQSLFRKGNVPMERVVLNSCSHIIIGTGDLRKCESRDKALDTVTQCTITLSYGYKALKPERHEIRKWSSRLRQEVPAYSFL